jgi:hypothetical protein
MLFYLLLSQRPKLLTISRNHLPRSNPRSSEREMCRSMSKPFLFSSYTCRSANLEINTRKAGSFLRRRSIDTLAHVSKKYARMIVVCVNPKTRKKIHLKFPTVPSVVINMEKPSYTLRPASIRDRSRPQSLQRAVSPINSTLESSKSKRTQGVSS